MSFTRTGARLALGIVVVLISLAFNVAVSLAADFQEAKGNVCEGNVPFEETKGCPKWGGHVTGSGNVALGANMLEKLGSGSDNVAVGDGALTSDTTGSLNLAIGLDALFFNTTGSTNTASGLEALFDNTTGSGNTADGQGALSSNTAGGGNVASGANALEKNTTGNENLASGTDALRHNTEGADNVAIGTEALVLNTTGAFNVASGFKALATNTTGVGNVAVGNEALKANTKGDNNVASGNGALEQNTTGNQNVASGIGALSGNTEGTNNIASGFDALASNNIGKENVASGANALSGNTTGSGNVAIGPVAGDLITGSNNIDISNQGASADAGTTRVGTEGTQTRAFVAGVQNSNVSGCSVQITPEGQLGCNNNPAGSAVATFASTKAVVNGKCLYFTGRSAPGTSACPPATSGYSASKALSLAMPANGATASNLYAATSATVTGTDTAVVEVIDNSTGTLLVSCTVNSTNKNSCTNSTTTGSAAAGSKLEVKLTITGASGESKDWEVTFRY